MSGSLNKVILVGRLGKDPEVRSMNNGDRVANLSLATSESWKDSSGERSERTEWHRVVLFGSGLVDICEKHLQKGSQILIEGKLQTRKWQDSSTNQDRYSTEIVVSGFGGKMVMLGGRSDGGGRGNDGGYGDMQGSNNRGAESSGNMGGGSAGNNMESPDDDFDDDVPF